MVLDVKLDQDEQWFRIDEAMAEAARSRRSKDHFDSIGRASPGGKAGRRALMLPSPSKSFSSVRDEGHAWNSANSSRNGGYMSAEDSTQ